MQWGEEASSAVKNQSAKVRTKSGSRGITHREPLFLCSVTAHADTAQLALERVPLASAG